MLRQVIARPGPVELIDVETLDDEDFVAPFGMMGAPTVIVEKIPNGDEMVEALRALERYRRRAGAARCCARRSAASMPCCRSCSRARCGLPVVDGDGMGRAFPQLQMTTYHIGGVSAGPMVMADEYSQHGRDQLRPQPIESRAARPQHGRRDGRIDQHLPVSDARPRCEALDRARHAVARARPRPHGARGARQKRATRSLHCSAILRSDASTTSTATSCSRARPSTCCARRRPAGQWARW